MWSAHPVGNFRELPAQGLLAGHCCFSFSSRVTTWSPNAQDASGPLGLVLRETSFYAEAGGQVADTGTVAGPSRSVFTVEDTQVRLS